jgi:2'-5' RNA ligase
MLLDIVILPPKNTRKLIATVTKKIAKKYPLRWRVDDRKLIPHITLFHILMKKSDLPKLYEKLERITRKHKQMNLSFTDVRPRSFALGISVKNTPHLYNLHKEVVQNLNQYRTGVTAKKFFFPIKASSSLERQYLKKYGKPRVLKLFLPHITLCLLKDQSKNEEAKKFAERFKLKTFKADTIAIAEINGYFQVTKILKTFKLK